MNEEQIGTAVIKYSVDDAIIAELEAKFMPLEVKDFNDSVGLQKVHDARMELVHLRGDVEKSRTGFKSGALEYGRRVDGEAKRLTEKIKKIEDHLAREEKKVEDEKQRLADIEEAKEKARITERADRLLAVGMTYDPIQETYRFGGLGITLGAIKNVPDDCFNKFVLEVTEAKNAQDAILAQEEARKKAEAEKLKSEQEEVERKQAEIKTKEEEIARKQKALDDAESEQKRKAEIEAAKVQAQAETEARIAREAKAKSDKEAADKAEAERKKQMAPDAQKLKNYAQALWELECEKLITPAAEEIRQKARAEITKICKAIKINAEKL